MKPDTSTVDPQDLNMAVRNTVGDMLTRAADVSPRKTAVIDGERRITFAQLERDAEAVAHGIVGMPHASQQREAVALIMPNSYEFLATYFGIAKSGRVVLPINYGLAPDSVAWILGDAEARLVFVHETLLPIVQGAVAAGAAIDTLVVHRVSDAEIALDGVTVLSLADLLAAEPSDELRLIIHSDDVVQCLYTSGTTATPKSALATHNAVVTGVMSNALTVGDSWVRQPPTALVVLPLFHVTALNAVTKPVLAVGGTVVLHNGFNPVAVLDGMEAEKVTIFTGLPMMWAAMIAEYGRKPRDLSSMAMAMYAMAQMPERVLTGMDEMMPNALKLLGSGQTEVIPATTFQRPEHRHAKNASWGMSASTVRTRIMDEEGNILPPGETGEIVYRGPHVTAGYWKRPEANEEAFRHGWFHSGDLGYMDEEGVIWFTDRSKDIIKSGGENVSSMKVERIMSDGPGVLECCVVGTTHDYWGEAVTLVAVTDALPDASEVGEAAYQEARQTLEENLVAHAKQHLGKFEVPKRFEFVAELPKTTTGKVRKNIVRDLVSG
ncbi:MAG: AMP-binding protein [Leucobacter sp.]|nr:AMP-binding protein [Leucobacter sp.]